MEIHIFPHLIPYAPPSQKKASHMHMHANTLGSTGRGAMATATSASQASLCALPKPTVHRLFQSPRLGSNILGLSPKPKPRHISVRATLEKGSTGTFQVIEPINGDPFIGSLETPITSSPLVAWYLSNLPAYRTAVSPLLRGVEVGLAHGFFLVGPFVKAGPLRNTEYAGAAGSMAAGGLVVILSICLTIYGMASFKEGEPSKAPSLTLTGRKKEADKLQTADGWAQFTGGFFFGGLSGVTWAYILLYVLNLPYYVK